MKRGTGIFLVYTQNSPDFENTYCFTDPKAKLQQPELLGFSPGPTPPWAAAEEARRGAPSRESGPPQPPAAPRSPPAARLSLRMPRPRVPNARHRAPTLIPGEPRRLPTADSAGSCPGG